MSALAMDQQLKTGSHLGPYKIVRLIGKGGMGEVYEAFEERLGRRVALKIIVSDHQMGAQSEETVRRFLSEAKAQAKINHHNVVTLYAIDKVDSIQYIAMEFVEGVTLRQILDSFVLSAAEAASLCLQMLEGLRALHEKGVVHRDLKPHNMIMQPNGELKLLDLGIAKVIGDTDDRTSTGVFMGTVGYSSPEIASGMPATPLSDLWSLGAIFFECVSGCRLVANEPNTNFLKQLEQIRTLSVRFPSDCLPWVPAEFQQIIFNLCARNPKDRYANAGLAINDLKKFVASHSGATAALFGVISQHVANANEVEKQLSGKGYEPATVKRLMTLAAVKQDEINRASDRTVNLNSAAGLHISPEAVANAIEELKSSASRSAKTPVADIRPVSSAAAQSAPEPRRGANKGLALALVVFLASLAGGAYWYKLLAKARAPVNVQSMSPNEKSVVWTEPTQVQSFKWTDPDQRSDLVIEIASDESFNSLLISDAVQSGFYRPAKVLPEGHYYWRVKSKQNGSSSKTADFFVAWLQAPEAIAPDIDAAITLPAGTTMGSPDFKWKCKTGANEYRWQLSAQADFAHPVQDRTTKDCEALKVPTEIGKYFWRVRVESPTEASAYWSATRSLTLIAPAPQNVPTAPAVVEAKPATPPAAPAQPVPAEKHEVRRASAPKAAEMDLGGPKLKQAQIKVDLEFGPHPKHDERPKNPPTLEWEAVPSASSYFVQISDSADFIHAILEENVRLNKLAWTRVAPGSFYWRVRAVSRAGLPGNFSDTGQIEGNLPSPTLDAKYDVEKKVDAKDLHADTDLGFSFAGVPLASGYKIQVSKDRKFLSAMDFKSNGEKASISLRESGQYYIRVAAANADGRVISKFSNASLLNFSKRIQLGRPAITYPPEGAKLVGASGSGGVPIVFMWKKTERATSYSVELSQDETFSAPFARQSVPTNKLVFRDKAPRGRIFWRVRAVDGKDASDWTETSSFELEN